MADTSNEQLSQDGLDQHNSVTANLVASRARYAKELEDPNVRARLFNSMKAEVGGQDEATKQKYLEAVFNRAAARGMTINDTISSDHSKDPVHGYYPAETISQLTDPNPPDYSGILSRVMDGSNTSNFATGNESGKVRSGGAPIVSVGNKEERFIIELNPSDQAWAKSQGSDLKPIVSSGKVYGSTRGESQESGATQQASTVKPYVPGSEKTTSTKEQTEEATPLATIEEPDHTRYTVAQPREELYSGGLTVADTGAADTGVPEEAHVAAAKAPAKATEEEQPNQLADVLNQIWEQHA